MPLFNNRPRWHKVPKDERQAAETFLRNREKFCVTASARFLGIRESRGHVWCLTGAGGEITALLLHSRRSLFPIFDKNPGVPGPRFLNRFLVKVPVHALQGTREDTEILERLMRDQGYNAAERIDYDLMSLDSASGAEAFRAGPPGLILRPPLAADTEALFALQSAYEQEEVVPGNAEYNPAVSRLNIEHILKKEQMYVAELGGKIVGKINTSARSFGRYQIGGVYVRPEYRGLGIGVKMTAVFAESLLARGMGVTLFVKKQNAAARAVYRKAGFRVLGDYRITYY